MWSGRKLTLVDVALNHDTHDGRLTPSNLASQVSGNLGLVLVVLERVSVAAVDHQTVSDALLLESRLGLGDASGVVVGTLGAASQNDEAVVVALSAHNSDDTGLGDGEEVVRVLGSANGINGNAEGAVGAVLETDGITETTGKLAVQLALGGSGANGTDGEQIGQELRRDGIEHLTGNGHALGGQVNEDLARQAQTLVDLEAAIDVRVVDEALPANSGTGLLEVRAHDNEELVLVLLLLLEEEVAVGEGGLGVVDGAGANDDEQAVLLVGAIDNCDGLVTAAEYGLLGLGGLRDLVLEQIGRSQRVVAANWRW